MRRKSKSSISTSKWKVVNPPTPNTLTRNQLRSDSVNAEEDFRFTVADNPGLISHAPENVGLARGYSFLQSIEHTLALVYVVDCSGPDHEQELRVLCDELEVYLPGLSLKARLVVANKAYLLGSGDGMSAEEASEKSKKLEAFIKSEMHLQSANEQEARG